MSYTIITNSGTEFLTSSMEEVLIGLLCKKSGAKYFKSKYNVLPKLAQEMTEEEANKAASCLETLKQNSSSILNEYRFCFEDNATVDDFEMYIDNIVKTLRDSKGYKCVI